ncbi:MAG: hypothetical protein M2R45_03383 [Verrucomicrobia subdivision 3 bacterium]|nr:hypothetical protein [Limisphaerales bacterium]MCS1416704.1 hypothetical protein [Limisphaerales bacterium]
MPEGGFSNDRGPVPLRHSDQLREYLRLRAYWTRLVCDAKTEMTSDTRGNKEVNLILLSAEKSFWESVDEGGLSGGVHKWPKR